MKKNYLFAISIFFTIVASSQSYVGFLTDNYSGVHGVINNPASIADSNFKADINLIGISALLGNDYYGFDAPKLFDDDYSFDDDATQSPSSNNNLYSNIDILGPSFMFNLNEKSSIAVFSRARVFINANKLNGETVQTLEDGFEDSLGITINEDDAYLSSNAWAEIGVSYARVLMDKGQHFLKGGISLKYLAGLGNIYTTSDNLNIDFDANAIILDQEVTTNGDVRYGFSENIDTETDDIEDNFDELEAVASGFGVDLGFIYEWRPDKYANEANKYKFKLGLSVTDLGSIDYDNIEERYDINNTISQQDFEDIADINDIETAFNIEPTIGSSEKAVLPTALHFNADWNINQKFYLNVNTDLSLTAKEDVNRSSIANMVSLTPRFERKWFTFQMPISVQQYSGFQWGAGFRAGPLYVGSGSVISALIDDETEAADIYAGLKIPIFHSNPKDKDGDGIFDKVDNCPEEAGPIENAGCPWGDSDNDTVLDNQDNCPNEAGPVENNGCPWQDRDNDTVLDKDDNCPDKPGKPEDNGCPRTDTDGDGVFDKDDNCPNEAGAIDNQGCPWKDTDGDGVTDDVDDCPKVAGSVTNKGCPEITEEVQKTLNSYAKTILFDSGKSSIKSESNQVLRDIVNILNEYPNAKFNIEGHTDSAGSNTLNQNLSDSRAGAVKIYLIENGIDQTRLTSVGYGEDQPIASNATSAGRAKNRRVEINLIN